MPPRRLFTATPSRLTTFTDCPRRYRMTYLDRPAPPKGPPWAHNTVGSAVHLALKQWWELPEPRRTAEAGAVLLRAGWGQEGFRDAAQSRRWLERGSEWIQRYLATVDPHVEPVGVERHVAAKTRQLALSGRVDRIDERGAELVIVDYKTGRREPEPADARSSLALALYAIAVGRTFRRGCWQVELHHLPTGSVAAWRHDSESLARQLNRAEETAVDIVAAIDTVAGGGDPDEAFPIAPGPRCGWCDLRRHCPDGAAAAPARQSWDALEPDAPSATGDG